MKDLKLERYQQLLERLKEECERSRVPVSEASNGYARAVRDPGITGAAHSAPRASAADTFNTRKRHLIRCCSLFRKTRSSRPSVRAAVFESPCSPLEVKFD